MPHAANPTYSGYEHCRNHQLVSGAISGIRLIDTLLKYLIAGLIVSDADHHGHRRH